MQEEDQEAEGDVTSIAFNFLFRSRDLSKNKKLQNQQQNTSKEEVDLEREQMEGRKFKPSKKKKNLIETNAGHHRD